MFYHHPIWQELWLAGYLEAAIILTPPAHPVLFVPPPSSAQQELRASGYLEAAIIGQVLEQGCVEVAGGVRQGGPAPCISIKERPSWWRRV